MAQPDQKGAQQYFEKVPREWDALYAHEDSLKYRINRVLRRGLYRRYAFTFDTCGDLTGKTVLDIGCGTGRYAIECAKRGATHVVGIDFAPGMIEFSRNVAKEMDVDDRTEFITGNFLDHTFPSTFDVVLGLGLFDYVPEPEPMFRKIAALSPKHFVASFPRFTPLWGVQRHIRYYWIRKCPIYNYSRDRIETLCRTAPFPHYTIEKSSTGYLLAASARG